MKTSLNKTTFMLTLLLVALASCKKYKDQSPIPSAAYLRVFNDIPILQSPSRTSQIFPFFTFIIDPVFDANGIATGGAVVGDFLYTREIYSASYPIEAGNSGKGADSTFTKNYDYPGNQHVLTAPPINGFDLSAWAQVPSGTHRVIFISRPLTSTPFAQLSQQERSNKTIDAMITLAPGEVHTLEAVTLDQTTAKYGVYLRKEDFTHQNFFSDKMYACFYDLSGKYDSKLASAPDAPQFTYYGDTVSINYSYYYFTDQAIKGNNFGQLLFPGYNNLSYGAITTHFAPSAPYINFPIVASSYFFDAYGELRAYGTYSGTIDYGSLPHVEVTVTSLNGPNASTTYAVGDPTIVNKAVPFQNDIHLRGLLANFNYIYIAGDGSIQPLSTLNILEIVFDQVYQIQVIKRPL